MPLPANLRALRNAVARQLERHGDHPDYGAACCKVYADDDRLDRLTGTAAGFYQVDAGQGLVERTMSEDATADWCERNWKWLVPKVIAVSNGS